MSSICDTSQSFQKYLAKGVNVVFPSFMGSMCSARIFRILLCPWHSGCQHHMLFSVIRKCSRKIHLHVRAITSFTLSLYCSSACCFKKAFIVFLFCVLWILNELQRARVQSFVPVYCFSDDRILWLSTRVMYMLYSVIEHCFLTVLQFCSVSQMVLTILSSLISLYICSKTLVLW